MDIGSAISTIVALRFLGGPWLLALCYGDSTPQLLVLDLLLPQQDSKRWRILGLPSLPGPKCYTQCDEAVAEYPEFSVDPTQKIFVIFSLDNRALVIPVEPLLRRIQRVLTSPYIPWDDWMEDVMTVLLHPSTHALRLCDTKVLALCGSAHHPEGWGVRMYDLSKSGRRHMRLQQVNKRAGGGHRSVLLTPKWFTQCQMGDGVPHSTLFVGNKVVCFFVSPPLSEVLVPYSTLPRSASAVTIWQTTFSTHLENGLNMNSSTRGPTLEEVRSVRRSSPKPTKVQDAHRRGRKP